MENNELINWLLDCQKKYESISENLEDFDYQKGLMDGAQIAISSVITKLKKEDN
ncbi:hypothetical protein [Vagococcus fluvialis]|uniref:hypothetical protein n=1 Tax=Vagococcus fluvialis TaxID=2738 RepID=UPI002891A0EB|nr:hypothetical protein [Vagococcus fluvialis]MDT2747051.1 hypothetical protein [Vagococcus fluvialis]